MCTCGVTDLTMAATCACGYLEAYPSMMSLFCGGFHYFLIFIYFCMLITAAEGGAREHPSER